MKLKNKLLPLVGVAALAAVVAPATSCVQKKVQVTMYSALEGFTPTIAKAGYLTGKSEKEVEDLYVAHIKENPDIMAEDLAWWESNILETRLKNAIDAVDENLYKYQDLVMVGGNYDTSGKSSEPYAHVVPKVADFGISVPKIVDFVVTNPYTSQKITMHTISMQLDYEFEYTVSALCVNKNNNKVANAQETVTEKFTSTYTNIPFAVKYNAEYSTFAIETFGYFYNQIWALQKIPGWEYSFSSTTSYTDHTVYNDGQTFDATEDDTESNSINSIAKLREAMGEMPSQSPYVGATDFYCFNFGSYHLLDVQAPAMTFNNLGYGKDDMTRVYDNSEASGKSAGDVYIDFKGINYNYDYEHLMNENYIDNRSDDAKITLSLDSDLELPIYKYWNNEPVYDNDDKEIIKMVIPKDLVLIDRDNDIDIGLFEDNAIHGYTADFGLRATLDWSKSKEYATNHYDFDFRNYYAIIPSNTKISYAVNFVQEGVKTPKTLSFTVKDPIVLTWDEFSFLDFKEERK